MVLTYEEMQYYVAFAKNGTLSEVAEEYHISQPTITRAMKKAELEFEVPLFTRTKNSISLNDNGRLAAEELEMLLKQTDDIYNHVRSYDRTNRTIAIGTSAAVSLPSLMTQLTSAFPGKLISTELRKPPELLSGLNKDLYQLIILPFPTDDPKYCSARIGEEHLLFLLPKNHRFAKRKTMTLEMMNGENMLLLSDIGFWADIVKTKMPASKFLLQSERYTLEELITNSILPCFTSDIVLNQGANYPNRIAIPITNPEVNVTYYLVCKKENKKPFSFFFTATNH